MSVVQHIRERAGHFRWMGLLVVWAVFIAMECRAVDRACRRAVQRRAA